MVNSWWFLGRAWRSSEQRPGEPDPSNCCFVLWFPLNRNILSWKEEWDSLRLHKYIKYIGLGKLREVKPITSLNSETVAWGDVYTKDLAVRSRALRDHYLYEVES